jgi:hypothetical protein
MVQHTNPHFPSLVKGNLTVNAGDGADSISIRGVEGYALVTTTGGENDSIDIDAVGGYVDITAGTGDDVITVDNVTGYLSMATSSGADEISVNNIGEYVIVTTTGGGNDSIDIDAVGGYVDITAGTGDDVITVDNVTGYLSMATSSGADEISANNIGEYVLVTTTGGGNDKIILYYIGGSANVTLANGDDFIDLYEVGGFAAISSGNGNDNITVNELGGYLDIDAGPDNDAIKLFALDGNATVLGGNGSDLLQLDARDLSSIEPHNIMDGVHLDWDGGWGDDTLEMYFVSAGITNINVIGDNKDVNQVIASCSDDACTMLSRRTFLANIHDPGSLASTYERINIDNATASITSLLLYLNKGENSVYFDDTIAKMVSCPILYVVHDALFLTRFLCFPKDVFGGDDNDSFFIGQMFNDERNETYGVYTSDYINTTLTTKGYLSDGCSHPVTINGGYGNDGRCYHTCFSIHMMRLWNLNLTRFLPNKSI